MARRVRAGQVGRQHDLSAHLTSPEVVDGHHAGQVQQHAQALEGGRGEPQPAVLPGQTGRVVSAVGAAHPARKALTRHIGSVVSARAPRLT